MSLIKTTLKQPLVHFMFLGALLFMFYSLRGTESGLSDASQINVDRAALLTFLQYRANTFNEELFAEQLDNMSAEQRQLLIDDYFREEALYREALAMGMDEGDYDIKQRMVEKLVFLLQDTVTSLPEPAEEELQAYYAENADVYRRPASYTFTHVYVSDPEHTQEGRSRAEALLTELSENNIDFFAAQDFGDRFPYLQNYVRRSRDFIRNNFDDDFADSLDTLPVQDGLWQGPLESSFGFHLLMLSNRFPAELLPLEDMRDRILEDYYIERLYQMRREAENRLLEKYQLVEGEL
tara:strand:- start:1028 stop:1909 length:882 start_codon:yes stop_codon:yes gene_type:complete